MVLWEPVPILGPFGDIAFTVEFVIEIEPRLDDPLVDEPIPTPAPLVATARTSESVIAER
jgi:hypothetical protein